MTCVILSGWLDKRRRRRLGCILNVILFAGVWRLSVRQQNALTVPLSARGRPSTVARALIDSSEGSCVGIGAGEKKGDRSSFSRSVYNFYAQVPLRQPHCKFIIPGLTLFFNAFFFVPPTTNNFFCLPTKIRASVQKYFFQLKTIRLPGQGFFLEISLPLFSTPRLVWNVSKRLTRFIRGKNENRIFSTIVKNTRYTRMAGHTFLISFLDII